MARLSDSLTIGKLTLKNRIVMAPLTRARAGASRVPNDLMADYYAQRAGAGLIVAEATAISPAGYGWKDAPGIYTDEQEAAWRTVTKAVHDAGGRIFLQLWHMGRVSHPDLQDGETPIAPSAIAAEGVARSLGPDVPYVVPRAMTKEDIRRTLAEYAAATERALQAGFDGVEIHGANGYLIDQFLHDGSNVRTDEYGGSIEGRMKFLHDVIEVVTAIAGADRTGLRLSPVNGYNSMYDSDLRNSFVAVAQSLNAHKLAYLHVKEPVKDENGNRLVAVNTQAMRAVYDGVMIVNDGYDAHMAAMALESNTADAVAFGRAWIANPDLDVRIMEAAPLNEPRPDLFYKGGAEGYTDYPFLSENRKVSGHGLKG